MKSYSDILAALEARKDRSAWDKGVTAYAMIYSINTRSGQNSSAGKQPAARSWKNGC